MSTKIPYWMVRAGVFGLLNALNAPDVATLTANLSLAPTADTILTNPVFNEFSVNLEVLNAQEMVAAQICKTEGHPRRTDFLSLKDVGHLEAIPTAVGGIGAVYTPAGIPMTSVDVNRLWDMLTTQMGEITTGSGYDCYYAIDGVRLYTTLPSGQKAKVEVFDYDVPTVNFAALQAYFSIGSPVASLLYAEFRAAWTYLAAGLLASHVGTYDTESANYIQMAVQMLQQLDVALKIPIDFRGAAAQ